MVLSSLGLLLLWWNTTPKASWGGKKRIYLVYSSMSPFIIKGSQDKNSNRTGTWRRTEAEAMHYCCLLPVAGPAWFLLEPRTPSQSGQVTPTSVTNYENVLQKNKYDQSLVEPSSEKLPPQGMENCRNLKVDIMQRVRNLGTLGPKQNIFKWIWKYTMQLLFI